TSRTDPGANGPTGQVCEYACRPRTRCPAWRPGDDRSPIPVVEYAQQEARVAGRIPATPRSSARRARSRNASASPVPRRRQLLLRRAHADTRARAFGNPALTEHLNLDRGTRGEAMVRSAALAVVVESEDGIVTCRAAAARVRQI